MISKETMIGVTIVENQDILNRIVQNGGGEAIREMKIQKILEHGNREKPQTMSMMRRQICVSWH